MKKSVIFVLFVFIMVPGRSQIKPTDPNQLFMQLAQSRPDTTRIGLLIQLADYYFGKIRLNNRMDSVEFYLIKARELNKGFHIATLQNRINILYAKHYCTLHPVDVARNVFIPVIDTCKKTGDKSNEAQAWMELGIKIVVDSQSTQFKLTCYQNALVLARQLRDDYTELKLLNNIASVHLQQRKFDLAESENLGILKEEKKAGPATIMNTCDQLASIYMAKGEYDKALLYALKTQKMMGISGDSTNAGIFYGRLSGIYRFLGKPAESLEWAKKNLDHKMATNNVAGIYSNIDYIAYLLLGQGKPKEALAFLLEQIGKKKPTDINDQRKIQGTFGDTYDDLKMYDLAEKSYLEMIRLGNEQTHDFSFADKGYDNCNMGSFYFRRGNYTKALPFLEIALKNYETNGELPYIQVAHIWLFKTDSALGNYVSAIKHLKQNNQLADSLFKKARNKQIEELQIAYHTEQKDKDFQLLAEKDKLTQEQLQNTKNTRNWIIAAASLFLIIAGLLYSQALLRKKNNRIIKNKSEQLQHLVTEKEWLLKEVHHRVKNNLHTVIALLESQATYLQDDALKANEISKHRIYAMSLIHQQLYKAEDIKTIDMSVYLPELLDYLSESFGTGRKIRFRRDIEPLKLGVSQAIPIALIVNEAVTNSIKYAFLPGKEGIISISMHQAIEKISLIISDNGIGIDPAITKAESTSMGLKLMKGLSGDIDGEINFINDNGTRIEISFHPDPLNDFSTLPKNN